MSPEQAKLNQLDVDTRSDVYSLGVLLYELLTGETPLNRRRLATAALDEVLRVIREEVPLLPSTKVSGATLEEVARKRQTKPQKLPRQLRGELDWIVMKCLEKARDQRYDSPGNLARDVERYMTGEALEARAPTLVSLLSRYAKRHRVRAALALMAIVFTTTFFAMIVFFWLSAVHRSYQWRERELTYQSRQKMYETSKERYEQGLRDFKQRVDAANRQILRESFGRQLAQRELVQLARLYLSDIDRAALSPEMQARVQHIMPIYHRLANLPPDAEGASLRAAGLSGLGRIQWLSHDSDAAEKSLRAALPLWEDALKKNPSLVNLGHDYAGCLLDLGQICAASDRKEEALAHLQLASEKLNRSLVALLSNPGSKEDLKVTYELLASLYRDLNREEDAKQIDEKLQRLQAMPNVQIKFKAAPGAKDN